MGVHLRVESAGCPIDPGGGVRWWSWLSSITTVRSCPPRREDDPQTMDPVLGPFAEAMLNRRVEFRCLEEG